MLALRQLILIIALSGVSACAQVPEQSVELSATVGRDIAEIKRSHLALVDVYYDNLFDDINRFINQVYMPYQVRETLKDDVIYADITSAIDNARRPDPTGAKQKEALEILSIFLEEIHNEVESYRKSKLDPVKQQKDDLVKNITDSYDNVHYANSIVTAHLASVVKVHDAQSELLEKVDLADLRSKLGIKAAGLSTKVNELVDKGAETDTKLDDIIGDFEAALDNIGAN